MCTTKSTPVREKKLAKLSHKERIVLSMPILALHLLLQCFTIISPFSAQSVCFLILLKLALVRSEALACTLWKRWLGHPVALVDPGLKVGVTRNLLCKIPERLSLSLSLSFT